MYLVTISGLPLVLTYGSVAKDLAMKLVPEAIKMHDPEAEVVVFEPADLVQWRRGEVMMCRIDSDRFDNISHRQAVVSAVADAFRGIRSSMISDTTELKTCKVVIYTGLLNIDLETII